MNELIVKESDVTAIENGLSDSKEMHEAIAAVIIRSKPSMEIAVNLKNTQKNLIAEIESAFNPSIDDANKLHKGLIKSRNKYLDPAKTDLRLIQGKIRKFEDDERRRLEEIQRKARVEAERIAQEEREKELAEMEKIGAVTEEEIEDLKSEPLYVEPVKTQATNRSSVEGVKYRDNWQWQYTDREALVDWLYANRKDLLLVDESAIGKMVKAMKDGTTKVLPGIAVKNNRTVI